MLRARCTRRCAPRRAWRRSAALAAPWARLLATTLLTAAAACAAAAAPALPAAPPQCTPDVTRRIAFGVGSGAHQFEGAGGGAAPSVWEPYIAANPKATADGTNASLGAGFLTRAPADVALLKRLGARHFRLSISWPRLLPGAVKGSPPNPEAVEFYTSLLDGLLAAGIEPLVALYHWDMPQALQEAYGGFTSPKVVDDYLHFADTAFRLFGPKVKTWLTFIEPSVICNQQYGNGQFAPGIDYGDKGRYACGHQVLLAHAAAARLYRARYAPAQGGRLSFSALVTWPEPAGGGAADKAAAQNKLDAEVGWFLDPIFSGDYPASLRASKGAALPRFAPSEVASLRGSLDFVAANCFAAKWVWAAPANANGWREGKAHPGNKSVIGKPSGISWIDVAPWSQERMLTYIQKRYGDPQILISSSGVMGPGEAAAPKAQQLQDSFRLEYLRSYLDSVCRAVKASRVRLIGWYAWSFLDAWEWREGYTTKFGVVRVEYKGGSLAREPKASALWLSRHFFGANGAAAVPHA
ncbi:MAG: glycoside hydrolase superfamily [Monoraphidium minutum]|nr:MAG: glycoside hydrolase superfamily [Monoraphidium minutum]